MPREEVLKAFHKLTDGSRDPDCELLNAFHNLLDPEEVEP